jgi:chaperonin GroES
VAKLGPECAPGVDILRAVDTRSRRGPVEAGRHQLRPLFDQVVVKELDQDRMRRSGLVVPAGTHDPPPQQGIVLAVGPGLDWWEQAGVEMPVEPGDHVVFPASAGVWVEVDEERLLVCRVVELLGILEPAAPEPGDR